MESFKKNIYSEIASTAAQYIKNSAKRYLPASAQKEFMLWILANENPHQDEYLKMLGVASSIELEISMLDNIVDQKSTFQKLSPYLGFLNAYFAFETIQDNLAIGLAGWFQDNNPIRELQRTIVKNFNPIMIAKLKGDPRSVAALLAPYIEITQSISAYERCLSPDKMYEFANEYGQYRNDSSLLFELEHCFYPILLLNVETCLDLLRSLEKHSIYPLLQESLIARYTSVDKILKSGNTTSAFDLADLGAKTILVLPTLIYCIGALNVVEPNTSLNKAIKDGSLTKGVYSSALLVRLLNDIGTNLLTLNETERVYFFQKLQQLHQQQQFNSILELLFAASESMQMAHMMVRIRKDIKYGEFNICLDNIKNINNTFQALNEFFDKITFYSNLYKKYYSILVSSCNTIEEHFHDTKVSKLIFNMFKFHEKMYSIKFESKYGDYAVLEKGDKKNEKLGKSS